MLEKSEKTYSPFQEIKEGRRGYCVKSREKRCRIQGHRKLSFLSSASLKQGLFSCFSSGSCSHTACASLRMVTQEHIEMEVFGL